MADAPLLPLIMLVGLVVSVVQAIPLTLLVYVMGAPIVSDAVANKCVTDVFRPPTLDRPDLVSATSASSLTIITGERFVAGRILLQLLDLGGKCNQSGILGINFVPFFL